VEVKSTLILNKKPPLKKRSLSTSYNIVETNAAMLLLNFNRFLKPS